MKELLQRASVKEIAASLQLHIDYLKKEITYG